MIVFKNAVLNLRTGIALPYTGELELRPGSITVITGENGSGKSLTLAALAALYGKNALSIVENIGGSVTKPRIGPRVSFVRQEPLDNYIGRSFSDELMVPLLNFDYPGNDARKRIEQILTELDLRLDLLDKPIQTLSSGEQQLFSIAVNAITDPDLLLLDEPLSRLDDSRSEHTLRAIEKLAHKIPVVVATHEVDCFIERVSVPILLHEVTRSSDGITINPVARPASVTRANEFSQSRRTPVILPGVGTHCMKVCPGNLSIFHPAQKAPLTSCSGINVAVGTNLLYGDNGVGKTLLARCIAGLIPVNSIRAQILPLVGDLWGLLSGLHGQGDFGYVLPAKLNHQADLPAVTFKAYRGSGFSTFRPAQPSFFLSESTIISELKRFLSDDEVCEQSEFLATCGLRPQDDISHLSYGQKKLVMYATLPKRMRLVVLDEPLSGLSNRNRALVVSSIRSRSQQMERRCILVTANARRDLDAFASGGAL